MQYYGFRHKSGSTTLLHRGAWAGNRFAYRVLTSDEKASYKDVSAEVCLEMEAIWLSDVGSKVPSASVGILCQGRRKSLWAPIEFCEDSANVDRTLEDADDGMAVERFAGADNTLSFSPDTYPKPLPHELLADIFSLAAWTSPLWVQDPKNDFLEQFGNSQVDRIPQITRPSSSVLIACSQVCSSWRQAALGTPSFWHYIDCHWGLEQVQEFLARSGLTPLEIIINTPISLDVWKLVSSVSNRWETLRFSDLERASTPRQREEFSDILGDLPIDLTVSPIVNFTFSSISTNLFPSSIQTLSRLEVTTDNSFGQQFMKFALDAPQLSDLKLNLHNKHVDISVAPVKGVENTEEIGNLRHLSLEGVEKSLTKEIFSRFDVSKLVSNIVKNYI